MWPLTVGAQPSSGRVRRIGIFLFARPDRATVQPFVKELERLGYVDGKNVAIEYRDAGGQSDQFAEAAAELVRLKPDVILCFGGDITAAIKNATTSIPTVVIVSNDPVESGLVASLGRPGGNITGLTQVHDTLAGKSVELLKDTVPSISRVAILWNPDHADPEFRETQRALAGVKGACKVLPGIDIGIPTAKDSRKASPDDTYAATAAALRAGADGVIFSRKYSEMQLANLSAGGRAVKEFGR
jgi:ABC-type uncharacterized transport system substrate-binding protein